MQILHLLSIQSYYSASFITFWVLEPARLKIESRPTFTQIFDDVREAFYFLNILFPPDMYSQDLTMNVPYWRPHIGKLSQRSSRENLPM